MGPWGAAEAVVPVTTLRGPAVRDGPQGREGKHMSGGLNSLGNVTTQELGVGSELFL